MAFRMVGGWPRSLRGQLLLAVGLALMLAQGISAALLYTAQAERREAALVHAAAIRLFAANREGMLFGQHPLGAMEAAHRLRTEHAPISPLQPSDRRLTRSEEELRRILSAQDLALGQVVVFHRPAREDPHMVRRLARRARILGTNAASQPDEVMVAAIETPNKGGWTIVRMPVPNDTRGILFTLIGQTLLLFAMSFWAIALILKRITQPIGALTTRVERFAATRDAHGQIQPEGPDDLRRLILAHNAMEARLTALLDEKDVMLGAIGHDLKTPLAALRVRIESVQDEAERARMASTIEDITRSLDDILSLARVGRPSDPREPAELSALVAQVAEEFEDMGEPVSFDTSERIVAAIRITWLRRAIRNLVVNALRYGYRARITLQREDGAGVIRVEDDGPGIAETQIASMLEPFARGEPSRNSATGGAGLGLALARAIADQHGGSLELTNRRGADGVVTGLCAALRLPLT